MPISIFGPISVYASLSLPPLPLQIGMMKGMKMRMPDVDGDQRIEIEIRMDQENDKDED